MYVGNQVQINRTAVYPDLKLTQVVGPGTVDTDTDSSPQITVTTTVQNAGDGRAWEYNYVGIYLSKNTILGDADDVFLGNRYTPALASLGESTTDATVTIPRTVEAGLYTILAKADYTDRVKYESDEANNVYVGNQVQINRTVVSPDLFVSLLNIPPSADPGTQVTISNTEKNIGDGRAWEYHYIGIYLSEDPIVTPGVDTRLAYRYVPSLAATAESAADTTVTIPNGLAAGTYYVIAVADDGNRVTESNEDNNLSDPVALSISSPL